MTSPLTEGRYSTVVVDPPWDVKAGRALVGYVMRDGKQIWNPASVKSRDLVYSSMTLEDIARLRVADVAAADAHLYLWTINKYLRDAFDIAKGWGFTYSTTLVWAKNPKGGGLGGAFGISTEYCLFCRRGTLATKSDVPSTWFNWKRPYDERGKPRHSAKPPEFVGMVEQVSPGPYLEMFARERRLGWDSWGNEVDGVTLPLLAA